MAGRGDFSRVATMDRAKLKARLTLAAICCCAIPAHSDPLRNNYPTAARVEFVQDCMGRNGADLANLYKCSCVIDNLAEQLTYDDYVEASTFAHYASLPGEGGGIFRDSDHAKERAKLYRTVEGDAYRVCGLKAKARGP